MKVELVESVGTSDFAKKTDLANLKSDLDNIDTNKVKTYQVVLAI